MTIATDIYKAIAMTPLNTEPALTLGISLHENPKGQEPVLTLLRVGELRLRVGTRNLNKATQLAGARRLALELAHA